MQGKRHEGRDERRLEQLVRAPRLTLGHLKAACWVPGPLLKKAKAAPPCPPLQCTHHCGYAFHALRAHRRLGHGCRIHRGCSGVPRRQRQQQLQAPCE